jgi:hypothetical protein
VSLPVLDGVSYNTYSRPIVIIPKLNIDHIYPTELEIKDTTDKARYASFLDLHLDIDSDGRLKPNLLDKRDDFYFPIVNFP